MKPRDTSAGDWMRPSAEDEYSYAVGWTIGGVVTLGTIIAVWMFAI